jgi:tryptophan synthase beta chain
MSRKLMKQFDEGYFGEFGGRYAPEVLTVALEELDRVYSKVKRQSKISQAS